MASWQWFGRLHGAVFRATGGRVGARLAGRDMLLLTTTGRRSGEPRTTPLCYYADGDDCVVVGSNNGSDRDPAWWLNLLADPRGFVEVQGARHAVAAHAAQGDERAQLWPKLVAYNPPWDAYTQRTERPLPVVVLRRVDG